MPYHLVLALEALASFGPVAGFDGAIMRPAGGVHVGVGAAMDGVGQYFAPSQQLMVDEVVAGTGKG